MSKYYDYEDDFDYDEYDLDYDLFSHKKSDKVKWVVVFILLFVLFMGMVFSCFISVRTNQQIANEKPQDSITKEQLEQSEQVYNLPQAIAFTSNVLSESTSSNPLTIKVRANVTPIDATNNKVDYSLSWYEGAEKSALSVTDYVTVTQSKDGDLDATVTCIQGFGDDKIVLTVTTREGGFTADCILTYKCRISGITFSTESLTPIVEEQGRGVYYCLDRNSTYNFNLLLNNYSSQVNDVNYVYELDAVGTLYTSNLVQTGHKATVTNLKEVSIKSLSSEFIKSVKIENNILTITTGDKFPSTYYSRNETVDGVTTFYDDVVNFYATSETSCTENPTLYSTAITHNYNSLINSYFSIKVTDTVTGLSNTLKVWMGSTADEIKDLAATWGV